MFGFLININEQLILINLDQKFDINNEYFLSNFDI
jgi:hypothetical protein